ncbi:nuclear transport factor 2 family protein [Rhodoplanes sp. Z2-YC6860]|uniref:nuclear transport factor 2 family protein n=1 Tax=Rhodoplanes sp. Z2-YC6860 TaxID=674703 RepID=UPI00078E0E14|nr:nuclear transport factor 2 family protein [Rhodoplanes sp. Z2-YC6860]AMN38470.1 ketosteroid isomerase-like protein [Rhodoplanes sp. Z2-YC6860]
MGSAFKERLNSLYAAFRFGNTKFLLEAFDEDIEFVSYSPQDAFPFLGHHRGKAAMENVLKAGYAEFEFVTYEPVFMVCEGEDAAVIIFARMVHRSTRRSIQTMIAHFLRFRGRQIVELREFMDSFGAVEQMLGHKIAIINSVAQMPRADVTVMLQTAWSAFAEKPALDRSSAAS